MIRAYWVSTKKFTCGITLEDQLIIKTGTAPILMKFIGQPIQNLLNWLDNNFEDYKLKELK